MSNTIYLKGMDTFKFVLLAVLIIIIGFAEISESTCDSKCLNSTADPAGPACNETTGECLFGCVAGFTGPGCQLQCEENCLNCNVSSSAGLENETECNLCSLNYFKNGSHCESCNANCHGNSSSTRPVCNQTDGTCMNSCDNGFYGLRCDIPCSATCRENFTLNGTICRQNDGFCEFGCEEGYYGDKCDLSCSSGCSANGTSVATCSQVEGHCDFGCINGSYTITCNETCSEFCLQDNTTNDRFCNQTNGHCNFGCMNGYYGSRCNNACSEGCAKNATSAFPVCDAIDGTCNFGCDNTSFNAQCTGTCSQHCMKNSTSDTRACSETNGHCEFGCENGTYGVKCDKICSGNCLKNLASDPICYQDTGTCTFGCEDTFGGPKCDTLCQNLCLDRLCEQNNANHCSTGCDHRFNLYGESCREPCSDGCYKDEKLQTCHQNGTCKQGCKINFWGPTCTECNEDCIGTLSTNEIVCNSTDGFCLLGCKSNKYGITCSDNCPAHCNDSICNQIDGRCVNKCKKDHYGDYCNNTCSPNCRELENICFPENGTCIAETCKELWFGPRCEKKCPKNCMNQICQRNSGYCSDGCKAGYFGDTCETGCLEGTFGTNCDTNCSVGCENSTCDAEDGKCQCVGSYIGAKCDTQKQGPGDAKTDVEPVISGSVGGAALILLIISTVILCVWRRRKEEEFVRRRKPKNRKALSEIIRKSIFSKSIAGPKRILIDNLLKRVMDMSESDFETEFNDIESTSANKPVSEAKKAENLSKNCFVDVYPYDENRVVLRSLSLLASGKEIKAKYRKTMDIITGLADLTEDDPDYINASFIEGYAGAKQRYIAAQAPISATVKDFWKMVIQEKVSVIVMMTEYETKGLFKKYWPDVDKTDEYHNGDIKIHGVKEEVFADFSLRTFKVEWFSESRQIKHLQFTSWPSEGIPSSSAAMIEFYHKFRSIEPDEATPIVIHCTSGAGRTGCFIALDLSVDEGEEDHSVDVSMCVTRLREQRIHMVQSESQYEFLYKTIAQVLSLRSYPVDRDKLKKEWKAMKKDDDKLHKTFEDIKESVTMDFTDYESISKNGEYTDKNREGSDIPEDEYRPTLPNDEYINAVYINTYKKKNGMIVTQMPTPDTVDAFLRLICQERCHTIVMMNDENFDDETQCKYWPKYNTSSKHGDIFVTTTEIMDVVNYLRIKLSLSDLAKEDDPNNKFTVTLYQISTWKDGNACPKNEVSCLSLVREVLRETADSNEGNILVHCLNGSERSGLFASLYILLEKLNYEKDISVVNTVRQIKTRRPTAIPNQEQFHFIYDCLVSYIENYSIEIKFIPEGRPKKQSRASVMYSIPDKKKRSDLYAKPDKKKKGSADIYSKPDKRRKASSSDGAASGSGTNKKKNRKTSSKGESKDTVVSIEDTTDVTILVDGDAADKAVKKTVEDSSADLDNTHTNGGMNPRISND